MLVKSEFQEMAKLLLSTNLMPKQLGKQVQKILENLDDFRVLTRLVETPTTTTRSLRSVYRILVLDTETTGLDAEQDRIFEIGYALVGFDRQTGEICCVYETGSMLQDPGIPIPNRVTRLTGISDKDVVNQSFDRMKFKLLLAKADGILAHNAAFDRQFLEREFEEVCAKAWICSFRDIDWDSRSIASSKLSFLAHESGFFFDAHRALADVQAVLQVVERNNAGLELIKALTQPMYYFAATNSPMSTKTALKAEQFRPLYSDGRFKTWYRTFSSGELHEILEIAAEIGLSGGEIGEIPRTAMFSTRIDECILATTHLPLEELKSRFASLQPSCSTVSSTTTRKL
jgi:DNA polymerase-3 subunit epsilon